MKQGEAAFAAVGNNVLRAEFFIADLLSYKKTGVKMGLGYLV